MVIGFIVMLGVITHRLELGLVIKFVTHDGKRPVHYVPVPQIPVFATRGDSLRYSLYEWFHT